MKAKKKDNKIEREIKKKRLEKSLRDLIFLICCHAQILSPGRLYDYAGDISKDMLDIYEIKKKEKKK
jgi:NTP pyrophosphatase (non-canonical NTP hydrolase)